MRMLRTVRPFIYYEHFLHRVSSVRAIHSTSVVHGRNTGSSALLPAPRAPSKKQKKRFARKQWRGSQRLDHGTEKLKRSHLLQQLDTPEMKEYIEQLSESMAGPIEQYMLPDAYQDGKLKDTDALVERRAKQEQLLQKVDPERVLKSLQTLQKQAADDAIVDTSEAVASAETSSHALVASPNESSVQSLQIPAIVRRDSNLALMKLAQQGKSNRSNRKQQWSEALELYNLMSSLNILVDGRVLPALMRTATRAGEFKAADELFQRALKEREIVDLSFWAAQMQNMVAQGELESAEQLLETLLKVGVPRDPVLYTIMLKAYVDNNRFDDSKRIWIRMHDDGVAIPLEGFKLMLRQCRALGEVERAFFYLDELQQAEGLQPDRLIFYELIRACAKAPHFVNGYQNIIFDALDRMEGQQVLPNHHIYCAIIEAFAQASDPVAAEYYFWEMQRKNMPLTSRAYAKLFAAYANAQSVGAMKYGRLGRYAPPPTPPRTPDEQAMLDVGPEFVSKLLSQNLHAEYEFKLGKRTKPVWSNLLQDAGRNGIRDGFETAAHPDEEGYLREIVRMESARIREEQGLAPIDYSQKYYMDSSTANEEASTLPSVQLPDALQLLDNDDYSPTSLNESFVEDAVHHSEDDYDVTDPSFIAQLEKEQSLDDQKLTDQLVRDLNDLNAGDSTNTVTATAIEEESIDGSSLATSTFDSVQELIISKAILGDVMTNAFIDPFEHMQSAKRADPDAIVGSTVVTEEHSVEDQTSSSPSSHSSALKISDITKQWDVINFGRAPDADYSAPLEDRRRKNIHRATLAFKHMLNTSKIKPSNEALNNYLAVMTEAQEESLAYNALEKLKSQHGLQPDHYTYKSLIKMHIRNKKMDAALEEYADMKNKSITPDAETFGFLVNATAKREMLVESLQVLEHAAKCRVRVPEWQLRTLRGRCRALRIQHPDMPPDPREWVYRTKEVRRRMKNSPKDKIQRLRALTFY